eukprot:CAMPEP_0178410104 /NCGR_PEP_ID=MMETSP0689_2-20121128/20807_1 /TAXON_ID=160604 /ORGANISM="Amphidinium massartii, Strain CS-259" /LENGTH=202 /DNA_ID=CAMNT_0020031269 /DNA_START=9 /DNA_END=613 /DNA_ORIENTATION=+
MDSGSEPQFTLLPTRDDTDEEAAEGPESEPAKGLWEPTSDQKTKFALAYIGIWMFLVAFICFMWWIGVLMTVAGNLLTFPVKVALILLAIMTALPFLLKKLQEVHAFYLGLPQYIEEKLWERFTGILPSILPMFETMMKGLLDEMEHRIIAKLKDMPKDVAYAVTHVSHDVVSKAGKAPGFVAHAAVHATHGAKDTLTHKGA